MDSRWFLLRSHVKMAQTFHLTAFLSLSLCLVLASAAHLSDLRSTQNRLHASAFSEDGKIVGGSYAYPGEFPYMVSIKRPWQNLQPSHWCGGALISTEYVLTAAHCVHGHSRNEYWVELGEAHRQITDGYEVEIKVDTIYEHEAFNSFTFENDVAILHLAEPANLTERIQLISIPDEGTTFQVGAMCNISGWGSTEEGAPLSVQLMKAVVPIVSREDCEDAYGWENLYEGMLCAGYYLDGGIDACAGDSGGPMVCPLEDGTNSVAGIVSWGIGCARPDYPGVYTETAYFRDWIREKTGI